MLKQAEPDCHIIFRTYVKGRRRLEYDQAGQPGSGGAPDEMLWDNPNIDQLIDFNDPLPRGDHKGVALLYARVGGPPLDVPLQARYFEQLGLPWTAETRFEADYFIREQERADAAELLRHHNTFATRWCVITPRCGWAGKMWNDEGWSQLIFGLLDEGFTPITLAGHRLHGAPWSATVNLTGQLDMRYSAAILERADAMVCTEGGLSNLRFALRKTAVVLTCATRIGLQVWAPPELCTEIRNEQLCDPCMWRLGHIAGKADCPPGKTTLCPQGRSLRDVGPEAIWPAVRRHLEEARRDGR